MQARLLVIDVGMTNCKTVLLGENGTVLDRAVVAYPTHTPRPGWVEQDPQEWWAAIRDGLGQLRRRSPEMVSAVAGISVTGHMHSLVCLGADDTALMRAIVLGDQRSISQAEAITTGLGAERVYALTGTRMDASMPAAKLRWLGDHVPEIQRHARAFLPCKDFVRHRLTGDLLTDPVDACGMSLYDIQRQAWSPELIALAGVHPSQLPDIADPCQLAGMLKEDAARDLGLRAGIPVVVGSGDDVEVLGNGLIDPGLSLEHLGTTGSILTCADRPVYDPEMAVELYPHIMPGLWVLGGSVTAAGSALSWSRQVLRERSSPGVRWGGWGHPDPGGASAPAGSPDPAGSGGCPSPGGPQADRPLIFVPHLAGERCPAWEPHARGAWVGLSAEHTADDLLHAVFEGIAFSLKRVLERIERLVGQQDQIRVSGGGGPDVRWQAPATPGLTARASIYGRPLALLNTDEPTALGAMMLAAVGLGMVSDLTAAVQAMARVERLVEPDAALAQEYERLYPFYCAAEDALRLLIRRWQAACLSAREGSPDPVPLSF